ncbi:MAG: M24 family metallopeptidase [Bacteroidia bacterium]|nr:M24 family metallopeptidase [Bacteroidia bacterium]
MIRTPGSAQEKVNSSSTFNSMALEKIVSAGELTKEIDVKLKRVQQFLQRQSLKGILLTKVNNFSWITAGIGDNHIVITSETGPASLLIMRDGKKYLIANTTEVSHLMQEDLNGLGYEPLQFEWFEATGDIDPKLKAIESFGESGEIGTDVPYSNLKYIENEFAPLRYELTPSEIKKYRWVGNQSSEAVAAVCRLIKPGMTEKEIESVTSNELMKRGLRPTVILIGTDERVLNYYHYPPQEKKLKKYAIVNVCARRWGLVSSVARYVYFGTPPDSLLKALNASATICANMQHASKPGAVASSIFTQTKNWYKQFGYEDYWKKIHVGGGIGYAEREWVTSDDCKEILKPNQALAWNPFTKGALSFDTFILYDSSIENITSLTNWPSLKIKIEDKIYTMPGLLIRR